MNKLEKICDFFNPENLNKSGPNLKSIKIALKTITTYEQFFNYLTKKMAENYESIEPKYLKRLPFRYKDKIAKVQGGMKLNQEFFNQIANRLGKDFDYQKLTDKEIEDFQSLEQPLLKDIYLPNLVIEWSDEGNEERNIYNSKIIEELKKYYNYEDKITMEKNIKVLVPEGGLLRLPYELLKKGYKVEANEYILFYILFSDYLFNNSKKNEFQVCPRIHSFCSQSSAENVTKQFSIPNVDIKEELKNLKENDFNFFPGLFPFLYKNKRELFDSVITLFSIDRAKNIIEYVEGVYNVLKIGGVWINFGTLDYWYSEHDAGYDLTWDELKKVIINYGFEIKNEETLFAPYQKFKGYMVPSNRGCIFFSAVKK